MRHKTCYPVNLDLENKPCLVVGGGKIAARKAKTLLEFGARVTVLSPELDKSLARVVSSGRVVYIKGKYQKKYLKGVFVLIVATDDPVVNKTAFGDATRSNMLVNVVDVPEYCNFIVPSIVKRGPLVLGISTSGNSPMFAKAQRRQCDQCLLPQHGTFVQMLGKARPEIKSRYATMEARKVVYQKILDSQVLPLLLQNKTAEAKTLLQDIVRIQQR